MMIQEWMMSELWLNHNHHSGMIREIWLMMMIHVWIMSDSRFTHVSWFNNHQWMIKSWLMNEDLWVMKDDPWMNDNSWMNDDSCMN